MVSTDRQMVKFRVLMGPGLVGSAASAAGRRNG